jgi:abortive infection bacteriophage resistance protein
VALLKQRGLTVTDDAEAADLLERMSYYRLSAYWHPFKRSDDTFDPAGSLNEAIRLYEFDRRLRLLVLDAIERFEVHLRTLIAYEIAHRGGPFAHEDPAAFQPNFGHQQWVADLHKEASRANEKFTDHYKSKYRDFPVLPIWMATEVMSIGCLSMLYRGIRPPVRQAVAVRFGVHDNVLESWAHVLTIVRNICAHHGRLWNRQLGIKPRMPYEPKWVAIEEKSRGRLFGVLLILREVTSHHDAAAPRWAADVERLIDEMVDSPRWMGSMGIPKAWRTHPVWKQE